LISSFPLSKAQEFNSRPMLLCSIPAHNDGVWNEVRFQQGDCKPDDLFILATDAVAKWFLDQREAGGKPWETLTRNPIANGISRYHRALALRESDAQRRRHGRALRVEIHRAEGQSPDVLPKS
jgi:hypothetical protein